MKSRVYFSALLAAFCIFYGTDVFPFGKNKITYNEFRWRIMKTIHFDVYYPEGMEELALEAGRIAEEGYVRIADYLNHELTDVVPVMLYPSHIDFQNNNIVSYLIGEGAGRFSEALKNRVVVPFTGSYADLRHVLTHELVHAFQFNILFNDTSGKIMSRFGYNGIPLWYVEGMAEYLSSGFDETADMVMRDVLFNEKYASLEELTRMRIRSHYLLYREGQAFFFFLEKQYGKNVMGEVFRDLRDMRDINEVLKVYTGKNMRNLSREWIRFYKKRYYHLLPEKNFDDEEGRPLTFYEKTESAMNVFPAVSPDGKRIAYLTDRNIYPSLVIRRLGKRDDPEGKKIRVLLEGNHSPALMHPLDKAITWSGDGKRILFVGQSSGRDVLYLIDVPAGRVTERIVLPLRSVKDPSLSADGRRIVFTGASGGYSDIYLYDSEAPSLRRLTADEFSDRYPVFTPDGERIIFSSARSDDRGGGSGRYAIYSFDLKTGNVKQLVSGKGNNIHADVSSDGKKLVYVSNTSGIYNVYTCLLTGDERKKVTDVLSGAFYPRWFPGGGKLAYVAYQNLGYDIMIKDMTGSVFYEDNDMPDAEYRQDIFSPSYFNLKNSVFTGYSPHVGSDWFMIGLAGTVNYGIAGFTQMSFSDDMAYHQVVFTGNYIRQDGSNDLNFDLAYYYLKNRLDLGIGMYRQTNPYLIYSIADISSLIHNVNFGAESMNHYGGYAVASYPFNRFFRADLNASVARYEYDYSESDGRPDVYANLSQVNFSLCYDNVLWRGVVPVDGMRGQVSFRQAFNVTGQDLTFSSFDIDVRRYFLVSKRYTFAFRGVYGKIFGPDSESFNYYLGGYNTLRGHPFLEYSGTNMFLFNSEFRFTAVEGINPGWPLPLSIRRIGGVLFMDAGSVWGGENEISDSGTDGFTDFETDMGFGFRFVFYPVIILKLDFAWPFNKTSFGNMDIVFSIGFEY